MKKAFLILVSCAVAGFSALAAATPQPPATPRKPVTDLYHGTRVRDDYQWLENAADPTVQKWSAAQNAAARAYLDKIPVRAKLQEDLEELFDDVAANYYSLQYRTGMVFSLRFKPPAQQPTLVTMRSLHRGFTERTVLNPNKLNTNGTTAIDFYTASRDGRHVAVSLSENGSEEGALYFIETRTGDALKEVIPRVQFPTAGGSAAWTADGTGVFYTRYPAPGEKPEADARFYQQVWFHKLGTPVEQDTYELGKDFPRIAETTLEASPDGQRILARVANGDGGEYAFYLRAISGEWKQLTTFADKVVKIAFGRDQSLYLLSHQAASRGKVLKLAPNEFDLATATLLIPEGETVIEGIAPAATGVYVQELVGGPSQIRFVASGGAEGRVVPIKKISAVDELLVTRDDRLLYRNESYLEPYGWFEYDPASTNKQPTGTILNGNSPADFSDTEVVREFATSKDGTKVPINIIRKKGTPRDGKNPLLLYGYGGYGISLTPSFDFSRRLWLDAGGIFAIANLRGGNEFGEAWHQAGSLTNKQNVFDDFEACANYLIKTGYTTSDKLAVQGGSNGGLLMGAFLTQHPGLARAVVSHVGIYDMLRVERDPNGAFNVTEFGSVQDLAQFQALLAYSPYHQVSAWRRYPAVLMLTGDNDGRVNPAHSRKMTAQLQAAVFSQRPTYLRTSSNTGHGMGSALSEQIAEQVDVLSFICDQLDVDLTHWISPSLVERGPWSGSVTPTSATIKAKLSDEKLTARLVVSTNASFKPAIYSQPVVSTEDHFNLVAFTVDGLQPDTQYQYAIEVQGVVQKEKRGQFRTFPAGAASFSFAFASCAKTASTNGVFDTIRGLSPLFYMNDGDFHYLNISRNSTRKFRRAYDRVLGSRPQAELYRNIPFVYMWDDHDYGGNDSNGRSPAHAAARRMYDEYVPHYPLARGEGDVPIYQSFTVGRAKFIVTDLRSVRDPAEKRDSTNKTMMGSEQKAWFKQELLSANGKYPVIFWVSSVPWVGTAGSNFYPIPTDLYGHIYHTNIAKRVVSTNRTRFPFNDDSWATYSNERREIANFVKDNQIKGLVILNGDSHMLAADDGSHSDYATGGGAPIPVLVAAPLDQEPSIKGGPYSQGIYRHVKNEGCFGYVKLEDRGNEIGIQYSGRNDKNEEKISLSFTLPAQTIK